MIDFIMIGIIATVVVLIIRYLIKLSKNGGTCMSCPDNGSCAQKTKKNCDCGDT